MNEQRDRCGFERQIGDDQAYGLAVGGIEGRVDAGEDEIVAIAVGAYMEKKFGGAEMSLMVDLAGKSMTLRGNKKLRGGRGLTRNDPRFRGLTFSALSAIFGAVITQVDVFRPGAAATRVFCCAEVQ